MKLTRFALLSAGVSALLFAAEPSFASTAQQSWPSYFDQTGRDDVLSGGVKVVPIDTPKGKFRVWTKRVGNNPRIKVLLLHGGPGATHEYFEACDSFLPAAGVEYYYYNQLGSAYSDQPDDESLWEIPRFVEEVEQVRQALGLTRDNFYLLGQSWGGMLAIEYALKYQQHLKGLIISNMMASIPAYNEYAKKVLMPAMDQKALAEIQKLETAKAFSNPRYEELLFAHYYVDHLLRMPLEKWPEPVLRSFGKLNKKLYTLMQGPSEMGMLPGCRLEDWDRTADLANITVPTLVIGARHDTMDPAHMEWMAKQLPNGQYLDCPNGSHLALYDDQQVWFSGLTKFLLQVDGGNRLPPAADSPNIDSAPRNRARDYGIAPGVLPPGPLNAITDVTGVRVGHATLREGESVRTGVTAVLPHGGNLFREKVPAAIFVANAFGKLAGSTQVEELGTIETPIILTNTLSVAEGIAGAVEWTLAQPGNQDVASVNAVVGETNDRRLNDIRRRFVTKEHVIAAIASATAGPVLEGAVGAGTGTTCFGFKAGIGTSSRVLPKPFGGHTVGVLVQSNFGGILTINGAPVGRELGEYYLKEAVDRPSAGSCMIVVATDAPLDAHNLRRLASRAILGLGATGSSTHHGSGEYVIAFSTVRAGHDLVGGDGISPLFQAVKEATEEAVYNSMFTAQSTTGHNGATVRALPIGRVLEILGKHKLGGRLPTAP